MGCCHCVYRCHSNSLTWCLACWRLEGFTYTCVMSCFDSFFLVFFFISEFNKFKVWFLRTNGWSRKYNHSMISWHWTHQSLVANNMEIKFNKTIFSSLILQCVQKVTVHLEVWVAISQWCIVGPWASLPAPFMCTATFQMQICKKCLRIKN
jgi:hypothetical protein